MLLKFTSNTGFEEPVISQTDGAEIFYNIALPGSDPASLRKVPTLYIIDTNRSVI